MARLYQKSDISFYGTSANNINSTVLALERGLVAPISTLVQAKLSNVGALAEKSLVLFGGGRGGRCTSPDWVGVMANCYFQAADC